MSKELYWCATTDVHIALPVILLKALNIPITLYMPVIKSIRPIGKPTILSIMDKVKTLAIGTAGELIVDIKITMIAVKRAIRPKSMSNKGKTPFLTEIGRDNADIACLTLSGCNAAFYKCTASYHGKHPFRLIFL